MLYIYWEYIYWIVQICLITANKKAQAGSTEHAHLNNISASTSHRTEEMWNVERRKYKEEEREVGGWRDVEKAVCQMFVPILHHALAKKKLSLTSHLVFYDQLPLSLDANHSNWLKTIKWSSVPSEPPIISYFSHCCCLVLCSIFLTDMEGGERVYSRQ